jgi:hypothetical protein
MPFDPETTVLMVAAAEAGPYAIIADLSSYDATHGEEDEIKTRVFGRATPYRRAGNDTDEYSLSGLYNTDDTDGQNVLRDAKDNRTTVFIRVLPGGWDPDTEEIVSGAEGYQQECRVTQYGDSGESDGEWVQCSFQLRDYGVRVPYTVPT